MIETSLNLTNRRTALECAVKIAPPGTSHYLVTVKARALLKYLGDEEFPARVSALTEAVRCCPAGTSPDEVVGIARDFEDFLAGVPPDVGQDP